MRDVISLEKSEFPGVPHSLGDDRLKKKAFRLRNVPHALGMIGG